MDVKNWIQGARVAIGMLIVQVIAAGLQLLSRIILGQGMFVFALMVYRHIVGTIAVAPFAVFFERGRGMKMSLSAFFWLFMVALTGITMAMGFFYYGLRDTTATYATNFLNLIPIVTYIFSTILRIEKLRLHTKAGKIKVLGASLCLAGAMTIALYKGKVIHFSKHAEHHKAIANESKPNWTRGTIFLVCSSLSYGMWFIIQVKLVKVFPYRFWATTLTCMIASVQNVIIGICMDRRKSSWNLGWNLQLVTIIYSGALATGASYSLISWAVSKRGPTYPSMFNPLALIFIAIAEALFLGEELTVGSLLGMALIIIGLYSFLFGKNMELKNVPPPKERGDEAGQILPESAGLQLTAVVMPADSPIRASSSAEHQSQLQALKD